MGLFDKLGSLFGGSSGDKDKDPQPTAKKPEPDPNATPEEALAAYVAENIPKEYPKSPCYKCVITPVEKGPFNVTLGLDLGNEEQPEQNTLETTELETGYLMEKVFHEPPYPADFTFLFFKNGKEFATVVKPFHAKSCIRIHNGKTDQF